MLDGLPANDTRADSIEDFARTAEMQVWANNLPAEYWEKVLKDDDMKGLEQYFGDITDTMKKGLAILLARHHHRVAHFQNELRTIESRLEHVQEDNQALKT